MSAQQAFSVDYPSLDISSLYGQTSLPTVCTKSLSKVKNPGLFHNMTQGACIMLCSAAKNIQFLQVSRDWMPEYTAAQWNARINLSRLFCYFTLQ